MTSLSLIVLHAALAAPVDAPLMAPVALPATGIASISVPTEMRVRAESAGDFVLLDANGREVPFIWVATEERRPVTAWVAPTAERDTYVVSVEEPVDGLTLSLASGARATVTVAQGEVLTRALVWNLGSSASLDVPLPVPAKGPFSLRFAWVGDAPPDAPDARAWTQDLRLDTESVPLTVGPPVVDARGETWWDLSATRTYVAYDTRLRLDLDAPTFARDVVVTDGGPDGAPIGRGQVFRSASGEQAWVPVAAPARRMSVGLAPTRDPMPTLRGAHLTFPETRLFVRDPGPGPHTLYGGRHRGLDARTYDLEIDRNELLRARPRVVAPGATAPNPAFVPPEVTANLVAPGRALPLPRWRWKRPIVGQGLVEVDVPPDVAAASRDDLHDVRVVDSAGLELPRTVASPPGQLQWHVLAPTRTEDGSRSVLEIRLPEPGSAVGAVRIRSDATAFSRDVSLERVGPVGPEVLAAAWWNGDPTGSVLELPLGRRVGDTLRVVIDNGNDAPLPISEIALSVPRWSLVTFAPPGGATLVYGNPVADDPEFDLYALADELRDRGPAPATLAAAVAIERPPLPLWDSALLLAGLAVASVALLAVTIRAALSAPAAAPPAES